MTRPRLLTICPFCAVLLTLLLTTAPAWANVGPPSEGGQPAGEPVGVIDVAITQETLEIDLRPFSENQPARVSVLYRLRNTGPSKSLDLLFASGSRIGSSFVVSLDGTAIPHQEVEKGSMPKNWQPPAHTPALAGSWHKHDLPYWPQAGRPMAFTLTVPPGDHQLRVVYVAEGTRHHAGGGTVCRQFAYVLAPARAWSSFGGLDLTIHLPPGWDAAALPDLTREGDVLRGSFTDLPGDAIGITVRAPEGVAYGLAKVACWVGLVVTLVGGGVVCWRVGRWRGRRSGWHWPRSLGLGVLWGGAVLGMGFAAVLGPEQLLPAGQVSQYGYGQVLALMGLIALGAVLVPWGFVVGQLGAHRSRREQAEHGR